jgi:predicted amidophosphoribosyltransferase
MYAAVILIAIVGMVSIGIGTWRSTKKQKTCPRCMAHQPNSSTTCSVCGHKLRQDS